MALALGPKFGYQGVEGGKNVLLLRGEDSLPSRLDGEISTCQIVEDCNLFMLDPGLVLQ